MNLAVDAIKSVLEGIINGGYPMELRVVGAHDCAVVANELFTADTEVPERLLVKETELLAVEEALRALIVLKASETRIWEGASHTWHPHTRASSTGQLLG